MDAWLSTHWHWFHLGVPSASSQQWPWSLPTLFAPFIGDAAIWLGGWVFDLILSSGDWFTDLRSGPAFDACPNWNSRMFSCVSGRRSYCVLLSVAVIIRPRCRMWLCAGDHWRRRLTVGALLSVPPSFIDSRSPFIYVCLLLCSTQEPSYCFYCRIQWRVLLSPFACRSKVKIETNGNSVQPGNRK